MALSSQVDMFFLVAASRPLDLVVPTPLRVYPCGVASAVGDRDRLVEVYIIPLATNARPLVRVSDTNL